MLDFYSVNVDSYKKSSDVSDSTKLDSLRLKKQQIKLQWLEPIFVILI